MNHKNKEKTALLKELIELLKDVVHQWDILDAKPAKETQGEEWAKSIGITQGKFECPIWTDTKQACVPGLCCHDCRPMIAKAYDFGHSTGYAKGIHDERGYAAQYESQQPEPKPAMTAEEWWSNASVGVRSSAFVAIGNYRKLNVDCIITKEA